MLKVKIGGGVCVPFEFKTSAIEFCRENFLENEEFIGEIKIVGEIMKSDEKFQVSGKIFCQRKFICDRCLNEAEENQVHDFAEELENDEIVDDFVDISELVRDTLIISQPIKNLCKIDCKGLCPVCGKNLNEGDCGCERAIRNVELEMWNDDAI